MIVTTLSVVTAPHRRILFSPECYVRAILMDYNPMRWLGSWQWCRATISTDQVAVHALKPVLRCCRTHPVAFQVLVVERSP
jgi:hypothetical protein